MKTFLKNYYRMLCRFKVATALNFIGLSLAFATFLIMMMQVVYEKDFDHCHSKLSHLYRFELISNDYTISIFSRPMVDAIINSSPQIEAGTIFNPYMRPAYITVMHDDKKVGFKESFMGCYSGITKLFDFKMVEGSDKCLEKFGQVLIPQSMAKKFFGNESAINKTINIEEPIWTVQDSGFVTIGGVYKDFPGNTQLNNCIYARMADDYTLTDWNSSNYFCYLLLAPGVDPKNVGENFVHNFDFTKLGAPEDAKVEANLTPFADIYFMNDTGGGVIKAANPKTVTVLILIAILIILVAAVNFTNFSTALTPLRLKNINIRKVLGSTVRSLRMEMIEEAMCTAFLAFIISLGIVYLIDDMNLLSFISADINIVHNIGIVLCTGFLALLIGFIAGLYPSFYITSFAPAMVLKGSFGLSPTGRRLRAALMGFQFVVSLMLIIGAIFIFLQNQYIRNFNLGFDKDQIAIVELNYNFIKHNKSAYVEKLKANPSIAGVAFADQKIGSQDNYMGWGGMYKDQKIQLMVLPVSWNFFDVMGIRLTDGNKPTATDELGSVKKLYPFESMRKQYGMQPGEIINIPWQEEKGNLPIGGFTDNVKVGSLRSDITNGVFIVNHYAKSLSTSYIRINKGSDFKATVDYIRKTVNELDPSYPVEVEFFDTFFNTLYQEEEHTSAIIYAFSIVAIALSLMGVFGLVIFESQYRRKEIGIRKVMGSTVNQILLMLSKRYLYMLLICFVIAVPVAYYVLTNWLERFAYKTPLYWWGFAMALLIVMFITVMTVIVQSWKAATANPRESITSE